MKKEEKPILCDGEQKVTATYEKPRTEKHDPAKFITGSGDNECSLYQECTLYYYH